jgi:hypothetical protein
MEVLGGVLAGGRDSKQTAFGSVFGVESYRRITLILVMLHMLFREVSGCVLLHFYFEYPRKYPRSQKA